MLKPIIPATAEATARRASSRFGRAIDVFVARAYSARARAAIR
jgi:hypothetical protein